MLDQPRNPFRPQPPQPPQPPRPSVILRPGIPALPPGVERYRVAGRGLLALRIAPGDSVTLADVEGGQLCELVAGGADGRPDTGGILSSPATGDAAGLKALLGEASEETAATRRRLERHKFDVAAARAIRLFGPGSPAGATARFTADRDAIILVASPGGVMDFEAQDTATPIDVLIGRADPRSAEEPVLPEPLADPLHDLPVARRTAKAYFVHEGEYIQVIDVAGRQCTDFQCFAARKLDRGMDLALDWTVTRTLLGRLYPAPGLPSKAFDREMQPLIEIVRDTCGRHDAFATACNPRYYDDMGYPGHVNCTENFNRVLEPYGVPPRKGWEALNYFYNTRVDAHNQLYLDEPWSRPGDYVLMRALTDIVCVSSACPDDIDPANAWNPTDIHVRTYSDKHRFSKAVALRMTPDAEPVLTRETAFHERLSAHTRSFTEYRGYWLPARFREGAIDEYWACREAAAIMDLSPLRKFEVTGPDAEALLQYCLTRDMRKLSPGQVVYTAMCYEHGGMIDDGTVFRLAQDNFRCIGGDDYSGIWLREQAAKLGLKAWVRSSTDQMHNVAVQGPNSRDILKQVVWTPPARPALQELGWFRFTVGRIGDFEGPPVVVSRTGYTGELGYEIFCHPRDAAAVFDAVWRAGEAHGLKPLGLDALDILRIEAGLVFAHYEFSDDTDPFEAGIGFTVPLKTKTDDFIGKARLIERQAHPRARLVGLDIDGNDPVGHGDCVHVGRAQIGVVTSGTRSPILKKTIALARLDVAHAAIGTEVEIGKLDGHQKRLPARIVATPHYDPEKTRVRS